MKKGTTASVLATRLLRTNMTYAEQLPTNVIWMNIIGQSSLSQIIDELSKQYLEGDMTNERTPNPDNKY